MATLAQVLEEHSMPAAPELVQEEEGALRCVACANRCLIREGQTGICRLIAPLSPRLSMPR